MFPCSCFLQLYNARYKLCMGPEVDWLLDASREIKSSNYAHIDHDIIYHSIPQMLMYCLSS